MKKRNVIVAKKKLVKKTRLKLVFLPKSSVWYYRGFVQLIFIEIWESIFLTQISFSAISPQNFDQKSSTFWIGMPNTSTWRWPDLFFRIDYSGQLNFSKTVHSLLSLYTYSNCSSLYRCTLGTGSRNEIRSETHIKSIPVCDGSQLQI